MGMGVAFGLGNGLCNKQKKSQIKSLDFVLNNVFMKIFLITTYDVVSDCITFFNCSVSDAFDKIDYSCLESYSIP